MSRGFSQPADAAPAPSSADAPCSCAASMLCIVLLSCTRSTHWRGPAEPPGRGPTLARDTEILLSWATWLSWGLSWIVARVPQYGITSICQAKNLILAIQEKRERESRSFRVLSRQLRRKSASKRTSLPRRCALG